MGPLDGFRFIEVAGLGPGPFCGMMLADMGADVIAVHRPDRTIGGALSILDRGKRSIFLDLKKGDDVERVLKLCEKADGLFEGFRPGVMEKLGLSPKSCLGRNAQLVYGRISGFGQSGPYASLAGHDINFLAVSGILDLIRGQDDKPAIPSNLVADHGGGGLQMAFALLCGVISARKTGQGQVIDIALSEAAALLASIFYSGEQSDLFRTLLNGNAPFYNLYQCRDGHYFSVGAIEPQFYERFLAVVGLSNDALFEDQMARANWPLMKERLSEIFATLTRDEWSQKFEGSDCCAFRVNCLSEVSKDPQFVSRTGFWHKDRLDAPRPSLRLSQTDVVTELNLSAPGSATKQVFEEFGL